MYPGYLYRWKCAREGAAHADCHGGHHRTHHEERWEASGTPFGVRRPLRFLSQKLELDEDQIQKLAAILDELKTERAQAAVDERRTITSIASAVEGDTFDAKKLEEALELRVKSAVELKNAVSRALERMHQMLQPEQRRQLAYLLRSGVLSI